MNKYPIIKDSVQIHVGKWIFPHCFYRQTASGVEFTRIGRVVFTLYFWLAPPDPVNGNAVHIDYSHNAK